MMHGDDHTLSRHNNIIFFPGQPSNLALLHAQQQQQPLQHIQPYVVNAATNIVAPTDHDVCLGRIKHPANSKWRDYIKECSNNHQMYPCWSDGICQRVLEQMCNHYKGYVRFFVQRDAAGNTVRQVTADGVWVLATENEIKVKSKQRFEDDRKTPTKTKSTKTKTTSSTKRPPHHAASISSAGTVTKKAEEEMMNSQPSATDDDEAVDQGHGRRNEDCLHFQTNCFAGTGNNNNNNWSYSIAPSPLQQQVHFPPRKPVTDFPETQKSVCFGWYSHPPTITWWEVTKTFSDDIEHYPEWDDRICELVKKSLAKEGLNWFLVFLDARTCVACDSINRGLWFEARPEEIFMATKEQFRINRQGVDQAPTNGQQQQQQPNPEPFESNSLILENPIGAEDADNTSPAFLPGTNHESDTFAQVPRDSADEGKNTSEFTLDQYDYPNTEEEKQSSRMDLSPLPFDASNQHDSRLTFTSDEWAQYSAGSISGHSPPNLGSFKMPDLEDISLDSLSERSVVAHNNTKSTTRVIAESMGRDLVEPSLSQKAPTVGSVNQFQDDDATITMEQEVLQQASGNNPVPTKETVCPVDDPISKTGIPESLANPSDTSSTLENSSSTSPQFEQDENVALMDNPDGSKLVDPDNYHYAVLTVFQASPLGFISKSGEACALPQIDMAFEKREISKALLDAGKGVEFKVATIDQLSAFLAKRESLVMHLTCHGHPDYLAIDNGWGGMHTIGVRELEQLIRDGGRHLELVVLASCCSRPAGDAIVAAGVPHVICCHHNQSPRDKVAIEFFKYLYRNLASGIKLEAAFNFARVSLQVCSSDADKFVLLPEGRDGYHDVPMFLKRDRSLRGLERTATKPFRCLSGNEKINPLDVFHVLNLLARNDLVKVVGATGSWNVAAAVARYVHARLHTMDLDYIVIFPPVVDSDDESKSLGPVGDILIGDVCGSSKVEMGEGSKYFFHLNKAGSYFAGKRCLFVINAHRFKSDVQSHRLERFVGDIRENLTVKVILACCEVQEPRSNLPAPPEQIVTYTKKQLGLNRSNEVRSSRSSSHDSDGYVGGHDESLSDLSASAEIQVEDKRSEIIKHEAFSPSVMLKQFTSIRNNENGETPHHSVSNLELETMEGYLLEYLTNPNDPNKHGEQPLHKASRLGHDKFVSLLLQYQVNPNTETMAGDTPLHLAASMGHEKVVGVLLHHQANPNAKNQDDNAPLHLASQNGHKKVVHVLMMHQADLNATGKSKRTPLHGASENGHDEVADLLLKHNANPSTADDDGYTPLHLASEKGHVKIVNLLFVHKIDPNVKDLIGRTPLYGASIKGNEEVVAALLQSQANPNAADFNGYTPLSCTCENGHKQVVKLLLEHQADPNSNCRSERRPLHEASLIGNSEIVAELLQHGAIANAADINGDTPLHLASKNGRSEVVDLLLQHKVDPNVTDEYGSTPLHMASKHGHAKVVAALLQHKADLEAIDLHLAADKLLQHQANPNAKDMFSRTALHSASLNGNEDVVGLLLRFQADPTAVDKNGDTPLHIASKIGYEGVVNVLLKHQANPNAKNKSERTPLQLAISNGHENVVALLLQHKADPNATDENGDMPLHVASRCGLKDAVVALLKHHANQNSKGEFERTPLHLACLFRQEHVASLLLQHLADPNATDVDGKMPLDLAIKASHRGIINMLLERQLKTCSESSPLHIASQNGRKETVELLLQHQANPNAVDKNGNAPLHLASAKGHNEVVNLLLKHQANPNAKDLYKCAPLQLAVSNGHSEVVAVLLRHSANPNDTDKNGNTSLHLAIQNGHVEITRLLLEHQAKPNAMGLTKYTPLQLAVSIHNEEVISLLLHHGADPNATDYLGRAPLYYAVKSEHEQVVAMLLRHGADPNAKDIVKCSPFEWAIKDGKVALAALMLRPQPDSQSTESEGDKLLHLACMYSQKAMVASCLQYHTDPNEVNKNGDTPLHLASKQGNVAIVDLLLKHHAQPNMENKNGETPLHVACRNGHKAVVVSLLDRVTNPNAKDKFRATPLLVASKNDHDDVVDALLQSAAANPNAKDKDGLTPLHWARQNGHDHVVALLLQHQDADPYAKDNSGLTPRELSVICRHESLRPIIISSRRSRPIKIQRSKTISQLK